MRDFCAKCSDLVHIRMGIILATCNYMKLKMKLRKVSEKVRKVSEKEESLRKSEESLIQNVTGRSAENTDKHL